MTKLYALMLLSQVAILSDALVQGHPKISHGKQMEDLNCALVIEGFLVNNEQSFNQIPQELQAHIEALNLNWTSETFRDLQPRLNGQRPPPEQCLPVWRLYGEIEDKFYNCAFRSTLLDDEMMSRAGRFALLHKARVVCMPERQQDAQYRAQINQACIDSIQVLSKSYKLPEELSNFIHTIEEEISAMDDPSDSAQKELVRSKPKPSVEDCRQIEKLTSTLKYQSSCVLDRRHLNDILFADDGVNPELEMLTKSDYICKFLDVLPVERGPKVMHLVA